MVQPTNWIKPSNKP